MPGPPISDDGVVGNRTADHGSLPFALLPLTRTPEQPGTSHQTAVSCDMESTIYVGGATYVKVAGKWTRGPWTTQQVIKREQENRQKTKFSCPYLREESVNRETAAVYSTHSETTGEDIGK